MPPILLTATFDHVTGLVENQVVNTFALQFPGADLPTDAEMLPAAAALDGFYNDVKTTKSLAQYMSEEIPHDAASLRMRAYDLTGHLDGSAHGVPFWEFQGNVAAAAGGLDLPSEVAACITLRGAGWQAAAVETPDGADPGTARDRPRARHTGRVYIGPLKQYTMALAGGVVRLAPAFVVDLLDAAEQFHDDLLGADFEWSVWSRVNGTLYAIDTCQVDNAFDTQRRRGADPSLRSTRTVSP